MRNRGKTGASTMAVSGEAAELEAFSPGFPEKDIFRFVDFIATSRLGETGVAPGETVVLKKLIVQRGVVVAPRLGVGQLLPNVFHHQLPVAEELRNVAGITFGF